jgi:hypothetical protein
VLLVPFLIISMLTCNFAAVVFPRNLPADNEFHLQGVVYQLKPFILTCDPNPDNITVLRLFSICENCSVVN